MGGGWFSRCEWVGSLFLHVQQGPANCTSGVHSCSANLSHCDCRLALPREHLFGSCCKHRHVCTGRSSGGNPAATIKPLKLIQDSSLRSRYWEQLVRFPDLPGLDSWAL